MNKGMYLKKSKAAHVRVGILALLLVYGHQAKAQSRFSMSVDAAPVHELWRYKPGPSLFEPLNFTGVRVGTSLHFQLASRWSVSSGVWLEWVKTRNARTGPLSDWSFHRFSRADWFWTGIFTAYIQTITKQKASHCLTHRLMRN
jgi:hypothetical protein